LGYDCLKSRLGSGGGRRWVKGEGNKIREKKLLLMGGWVSFQKGQQEVPEIGRGHANSGDESLQRKTVGKSPIVRKYQERDNEDGTLKTWTTTESLGERGLNWYGTEREGGGKKRGLLSQGI